jgi:hypothetical protein
MDGMHPETDRSNCGISPFVRGLRHAPETFAVEVEVPEQLVECTESSS